MKTDVPLQLRIGGVVLLVLGPVLALFAGALYLHARQAQGWPTVEAHVTRSTVEVSKKASGFRRSTTRFQDYYTAAIQYEYVVNGQQFTGNRIGLDASRSSGFERDDAERWVRRYQVGDAVTIHYSPEDPKQSVIDPSPDALGLALMGGFGLLAVPAGLVLRRLGRRMQPVGPPAAPVQREAVEPAALTTGGPAAPNTADPVPALTSTQAVACAAPPAGGTQSPPEEPRPTHWLVRTIAVVVGLVLLLFGGLALHVSVKLLLGAGNAPDHGTISIAVQLVMVGIMGGVTLLGAFLIWKGLKRRRRPVGTRAGNS